MTLSAEDRALIEERFARYMWAIDTGDIETLVGCFSADGALHSPIVGSFSGHEAIRKFARRFAALPQQGIQLRHLISNLVIDPDGDDAANVKCYLVVYVTQDGSSRLLAPGRYECRLRKEAGRWVFTDRLVTMDHEYTIEGI